MTKHYNFEFTLTESEYKLLKQIFNTAEFEFERNRVFNDYDSELYKKLIAQTESLKAYIFSNSCDADAHK